METRKNTENFVSVGMWPPWAGVNCITKLFFCRNKVLTTEVKALKQQMATVLEKGRHDDELIAALMVLITFLIQLCENRFLLQVGHG